MCYPFTSSEIIKALNDLDQEMFVHLDKDAGLSLASREDLEFLRSLEDSE